MGKFEAYQIPGVDEAILLHKNSPEKLTWGQRLVKKYRMMTGHHLIRRGILWLVLGGIVNIFIFLFNLYPDYPFMLVFWIIVIYGVYNIFRGIYYKMKKPPQ